MAYNRGKQFELKFAGDWKKTMPASFLLRLADQLSGYKVTSVTENNNTIYSVVLN